MTSEEISKARMNEKIRRPTRCMQIFRLDSSRHCPINVITRLLSSLAKNRLMSYFFIFF
jgi:hypothetical protein